VQAVLLHNGRHVRAANDFSGVPVVAVVHGGDLARFAGADLLLCVNGVMAESARAVGFARAEVIGNAIDDAMFVPSASATPNQPLVIGTLAAFTPEKGLDVLVDAAGALVRSGASLRLRLGGDGPARTLLLERAHHLGLTPYLDVPGWIKPDARAEFLDRLDVFVAPSRSETFGMALAEAIARRRPVVATRCDGPRMLLGEGFPGLVDVNDAVALAGAIKAALDRPTEYVPSLDLVQPYRCEEFNRRFVAAVCSIGPVRRR
jgi:glycosyltransferase involved in cell wall biosynthesis